MKKAILLIVIAVFVAIPVVFWARTLSSGMPFSSYLFDAGRLLALVGFVFILFQYVLSSRIRLIERGIGLDKLFIMHRRLGVVGLILVFTHPILLTVPTILQGHIPPFPPMKILGIITLLLIIITAGAAILYGRIRMKYETWKNIHRAGYLILAMAFVHSLFMGSDLYSGTLRKFWMVMACIYVLVLLYRLGNWIRVRSNPYNVTEVLQETHDVWSLYFDGRHKDYKPGQFMIVKLVRNGKASAPHPFTISSSPTSDRLAISVKSSGDFTSTIGDTKADDTAYIDAPYGVFSFLNHGDGDLVFIAGGIGITPLMSMLRYIYNSKLERNIILLWGNKTEKDIVFRDELEKMSGEMPSLKIVHIMSGQDDWPGEKGYLDEEKLKKLVGDFQGSHFFLCGPPRMMTSVEKTLRGLGVPKRRIYYERFALR